MSFVLPEEVLEKLKCSFCKQYLSCGPTKLTSIGVACGRCSVPIGEVSSLFNIVAQFALFPCVNQYNGCNHYELLRYDDVKNHEEQCRGKKYECPFCSRFYSDPVQNYLLNLINHYNQKHSRYILKNPIIRLTMGIPINGVHYLYFDDINNCWFFIYVNWNGESVKCNVSLAGKKAKQFIQMVNKTNYKDYCTAFMDNSKVFQISSKELQQQGNTVLVEFVLLHNPGQALHYNEPLVFNEGINNWPKMFIGEEFVKIYGPVELNEFEYKPKSLELVNTNGDSISIKCSFCENYFWDCKWKIKFSIIYCCTTGDINYCDVCESCYDKGYKMCYLHKRALTPIKPRKIYDIFFYCRNNCGLFFKFWQLQEHELTCFGISEETHVKRNFGILFPPSINYIKGNIVYAQNWVNTTEVYMVTHDGVKCILNIVKYPYLKFQGSHDYDKSKYFLLFCICENGHVREEMNNFSIALSSAKEVFFAVFLKEIKHKTMLVIKD